MNEKEIDKIMSEATEKIKDGLDYADRESWEVSDLLKDVQYVLNEVQLLLQKLNKEG